jgi:tetratricopeptide (TPR) repeat protein
LARNYEIVAMDFVRHQRGKDFQKYAMQMGISTTRLPLWIVVSPGGDYLSGGDCYSPRRPDEAGWFRIVPPGKKVGDAKAVKASTWRDYMGELARRHPALSEKDIEDAGKQLELVKKQVARGRCHEASLVMKKLSGIWYPKKLVEAKKTVADSIIQKGDDTIAAANDLSTDGKFLEAALAYARIKRGFGMRMKPGMEASKKLQKLLVQHRDIKDQYDRACQDEEAQELLEDARELVKAGQAGKAKMAYRALMTRFAETPGAILAKDEMAKLGLAAKPKPKAGSSGQPAVPIVVDGANDDPDSEAKAAKLVKLAGSYYASGLKAKAVEKLDTCVKKYPKTKSAQKARKLAQEWGVELKD